MNGLLRTFRTLRYLRPSQIFWRLWYRARRPWFAGARYAAGLVPKAPTLPNRHPDAEVWPGDAENGRRMIETETIRLLDQDQRFDIPDPWHPEEKSHLWRFTINYFDWLADLAATRDPRGLVLARDLVTRWIDAHPRPDAEAWHPYPLSLRLVAWMRHAPWLLDGAEAGFRDRFLASLHAQANHLPRVLEKDVGGNHLIKNLKALIVVGHGLPGHGQRLKPALARLEKECRRQILADGAHYERSPAYHVQVLCDLLDLHLMLADPPSWLTGAIKAMSAAYVTMRHGDGRLALFNDGTEGDEPLLVALDRLLAPLPAPRDRLPDMGLERLSEGPTLVLLDAGRCCPDDLPAHAHADTLSFELSDARQRIVVNCGTYAYQDDIWRHRLRATEAHSTVGIDDLDSAEVYGAFRVGRRPRKVEAERSGNRVTARHDGYRHLGIVHERRVEVLESSALVTGEDRLSGLQPGQVARARFHLHPDLKVRMDGGGVLITLPDGGRWRFACFGGALRLEDSVYAPRFNVMLPTYQIVLETMAERADLALSWSFERL